ncbi:MAG TPA: MarR family transcriptional regulator [Devosia sp.]|nr:MarR family transcriptional regulator [Devosia sp.]
MANDEDAYLLRDLTRDLLLAGRQWRKMGRMAAARHGVSEAASAPLLWIDRLGGNVRQNALAAAVGIEGASLVRLLDELQKSGLITRAADPGDRRANTVTLTAAGRKAVRAVNASLARLRSEVFAMTSRADAAAALRVFRAIATAAGDNSSETVDSGRGTK